MNETKTFSILWHLGIMMMLASLTVSCGLRGSSESEPLSEEELRLQRACHLDSTILATAIFPDSIDQLTAEAWILVEDSSGLIIGAKNADKRMYMASLTKMMTCLLTLEKGKMNDSIEITEDVFLAKDSRVKLGDGYLLGNLLREMMMQSDNDAATALAKHIGGNVESFCALMNSKATYLGMDSTRFANPNGLPNDSNYSSARDLLILSRYCMRDSAFAEIVGTPFLDIPLTDGRHLPCQNTNLLLMDYEGCIGVKTGYTRQAGFCLASAAERHGTRLFLILLNSSSQLSRFSESATLLDYGYSVTDKIKHDEK